MIINHLILNFVFLQKFVSPTIDLFALTDTNTNTPCELKEKFDFDSKFNIGPNVIKVDGKQFKRCDICRNETVAINYCKKHEDRFMGHWESQGEKCSDTEAFKCLCKYKCETFKKLKQKFKVTISFSGLLSHVGALVTKFRISCQKF